MEEKEMGQERVKDYQPESLQPKVSRRNFVKYVLIGSGSMLASAAAGVSAGWILSEKRSSGEGAAGEGKRQDIRDSEEVTLKQTSQLLEDLDNKVQDIYRLRGGWYGANKYTIQEGDSIELIAQNIGRKPEEILDISLNIEFRETSGVLAPGQELFLPETIYPSRATKQIFDRLLTDKDKLKFVAHESGSESPEAKQLANEIWKFWHTAPSKDGEVKRPVIYLEPEIAEEGGWIAKELKGFLEAVSNSGRGLAEVFIISQKDNPNTKWPMFMVSYKDKGATIWVLDKEPITPGGCREWTRRNLLVCFAHDFLGHALSLYSEGYNLSFLAPAEVVELIYEDTLLWDTFHSMFPNDGVDEEERHARWLETFFGGEEFENLDPKFMKQVEEHYNRIISRVLGQGFSLDELAEKLELR